MKRFAVALTLALGACTQPAKISSKTPEDGSGAGQSAVKLSSNLENQLILTLKSGQVVIKLLPNLAPNHVARVKKLARQGFYNGLIFHRVIPGFMAQTGDPTGTGRGGSKLPDLRAEFSNYAYKRGTVGAARSSSPDSANSQFFICFGSGCSSLTGQYTVWGQVIKGMQYVDKIKLGEPPKNPDKIISLQVAADVKQ